MKMAAKKGIDLSKVTGTSPGGQITVLDVWRLGTAREIASAVERQMLIRTKIIAKTLHIL